MNIIEAPSSSLSMSPCALFLAAAASTRAPLCFVAHGKSQLHCSLPVERNSPISVYDDGESPQRARTLFLSKQGKLCENKSCKRCLSGGTFGPCGKAASLPIIISSANRDWAKPQAVGFAALLVAVPVLIFSFMGRNRAKPETGSSARRGAVGVAEGVVRFLLRFASFWWFPLVAGAGTAINMFTIVFTGATVVIFLSAILGQPRRWVSTAVCNAAGATLGTAILLFLVRERGVEYLNTTFPAVLASPAWAKATGLSMPPMLRILARAPFQRAPSAKARLRTGQPSAARAQYQSIHACSLALLLGAPPCW